MVFFSENQTYGCDKYEGYSETKGIEDEGGLKYSENFLLNSKWKVRSSWNNLSIIFHINLHDIGSWNEEVWHLEHLHEARSSLDSNRLATRIHLFSSGRSDRIIQLYIESLLIFSHIEQFDRNRQEFSR